MGPSHTQEDGSRTDVNSGGLDIPHKQYERGRNRRWRKSPRKRVLKVFTVVSGTRGSGRLDTLELVTPSLLRK